MYYYRLEHGSFYLYDDSGISPSIANMTDSVAMAYDPDTYTMFKHGSPDMVHNYVADAKEKGIIMNIIKFSKDFPVEQINKVLSTSGYLRYIING